MSTPSESVEEQIFANVQTTLAGIDAGESPTTYWYTPGKVTRCDQFVRRLFDVTDRIIYLIRDTSEPTVNQAERQFTKDARVLPISILAGYRDDRADEDAHTMKTPTRGTIRHRMMRDIKVALMTDRTRGALAIDTEFAAPVKDFDEGVSGWILVELVAEVMYEETFTAP